MSNFYVILPSNTCVEGNRTNSFRVRLPRKLKFNSDWSVGLAGFVYPHTWPSLGTSEPQFVRVLWRTGDQINIPLPSQNFQNPAELLKRLREALYTGSEELVAQLRTIQYDMIGVRNRLEKEADDAVAKLKEQKSDKGDDSKEQEKSQKDEEEHWRKERQRTFTRLRAEAISKMPKRDQEILEKTAELGLAAWIEAFRRVKFACNFDFDLQRQRFVVAMDNRYVERVELSAQLAYILGYPHTTLTQTEMARFAPDMKGGVSSFFIYAPQLIEPVIIGDVCAPMLRMVNIRGWPDEMVEETYMPIQYHKLLCKEISDIFIEIRTSSGALMPFQYGNCTLTLHFQKQAPYF